MASSGAAHVASRAFRRRSLEAEDKLSQQPGLPDRPFRTLATALNITYYKMLSCQFMANEIFQREKLLRPLILRRPRERGHTHLIFLFLCVCCYTITAKERERARQRQTAWP